MGNEDRNDMEVMRGYGKSGVTYAWVGWEYLISRCGQAESGVIGARSVIENGSAPGILRSPSLV